MCLFCGGKSCSKENYLKNSKPNAINGLHSNWITPEILAMQRPSSRLIKQYNIIEQFKNSNIKAVFNLQLPGEHPYCGDKLIKESGFTYKSEDFTDRKIKLFISLYLLYLDYKQRQIYQIIKDGIFFFNFGWTDMEVTDNEYMIKIITHVDFIMNQGMKIAVHCHAGTGRTGLLIASWLILKNNMKAIESRDLFKSKRAGGLSKGKQLTFLIKFEEYLNKSRISFQLKNSLKLEQLVQAQEKLIFGRVKIQSRYQPFILYQVLQRLEFLIENNRISPIQLCTSFFDLDNNLNTAASKWNTTHESQISQLKNKFYLNCFYKLNKIQSHNQTDLIFQIKHEYYSIIFIQYESIFYIKKQQINLFLWQFSNYGDARIISQILLDFFDQPNFQVIKNESAYKLNSYLEELKSIELVFADESIVELLGRYEYSILSRFLVFAKRNFIDKNVDQKYVNQFILRICISLLGKRQELDNLFIERSFINTECFNQVVISLYSFLLAWLSEMIDYQMPDNFYFDKIFNRTSSIIEGSKRFQIKKQIYLISPTLKAKNLVTKAETILIGVNLRNEASEMYARSEINSQSIYTNINILKPKTAQIMSQSHDSSQLELNQKDLLNNLKNEISLQKNDSSQ